MESGIDFLVPIMADTVENGNIGHFLLFARQALADKNGALDSLKQVLVGCRIFDDKGLLFAA